MRWPYLRYEILEHFVYHKTLSKSMVEKALKQHKHTTKTTNHFVRHHRKEIFEAFEHLRCEGSIIKVDFRSGPGKFPARGRPETHYKITENGLKDLIANGNISGSQFWKVLLGYCSNNDDILTLDELHEFLIIFVWKNLKYREHGFATYFDSFHDICNNWFKERVLVSGRISTFQKVLEVLAIYPKIMINDLVERVGESESRVNEALSLYSYRPKSFQDHDVIINDYSKENYFIVENIIIVNQKNNNHITYELSLFGVMLTFLVILYNDMRNEQGLYLKEYSFEEYCDKIAYNYRHKLPLIFGKWNRLRRILHVFAIYNFTIVLIDESLKKGSNSLSVNMRGNREIFQGIHTIIQYNNSLMQDLVAAGFEVLRDYFLVRFDLDALEHLKEDAMFKKKNLVCAMLEELMIILNPLRYRYPNLSLVTFTTLDHSRILKQIEESFADEISAFYYMNLLKPNIDLSEMRMYSDSTLTNNSSKDLRISSLEKCLSLLVHEVRTDPSIRDWAKKWREDIRSIYHEIDENVKAWSASPIL
jgi:hypothetical protein